MAIRHNYQDTIIIGTDKADVNAQCEALGIPLAFPPAPIGPILDELKELRIALVDFCEYGGAWYNFNPTSRTDLLGLVVGQSAFPPEWTVTWRKYDDTNAILTIADVIGLYQAMLVRGQTVWNAYNADCALVNAGQPAVNLTALLSPI